ncbi:hypothetical protein KKF84_14665, partial [Myxococcota bacterium]|nr:hypothetical protein [Myxococcota bacterium]
PPAEQSVPELARDVSETQESLIASETKAREEICIETGAKRSPSATDMKRVMIIYFTLGALVGFLVGAAVGGILF